MHAVPQLVRHCLDVTTGPGEVEHDPWMCAGDIEGTESSPRLVGQCTAVDPVLVEELLDDVVRSLVELGVCIQDDGPGVVPRVCVRFGANGGVDVGQRQLLAVKKARLEGVVALDDVDVVPGDVGQCVNDLSVQLILQVAHAHRLINVAQFALDLVVLEQSVEDVGDDQAVVSVLAEVLLHGTCAQTRISALPE